MSGKASQVAPAGASTPTEMPRGRHTWTAIGLLVGFMVLYLCNLEFSPVGDATPNVFSALSLLDDGDLLLTPDEAPQLFIFKIRNGETEGLVRFDDWDSSSPFMLTWRQLAAADRLTLDHSKYYLVPTIDPVRRGYVSAFGPGAAITAAPYYALQRWWVPDLKTQPAGLWYGSKFVASLCVALSVVLVYSTLRHVGDPRYALAIAVCYGAGTCVWSISSQTLWQNGPNIFWLSLAAYCLFRTPERAAWAAGCGAALGMAVLCRSTSALVVIAFAAQFAAVAWWKWRTGRKLHSADGGSGAANCPSRWSQTWQCLCPLACFVAAGTPMALLLGWHNAYCFGSPWHSAHLASGAPLAQETLGSANVWQTPLAVGLAGLLFSTSRGMLIFSPILAAGLWGAICCWVDSRWRLMRPLAAGCALTLLVTAKHFNWHGGWSFGYRAIVDIVPLLAICAMVVAFDIWRKPISRICFGAALAWSLLIQVVGVYAYDLDGWNNRSGYLVLNSANQPVKLLFDAPRAASLAHELEGRVQRVSMNVDYAVHRRRLWSLSDNQIGYYLSHWRESHERKEELIAGRLRRYEGDDSIVIADTGMARDASNSASN